MEVIRLEDLRKDLPTRDLFHLKRLILNAGEKVALIGQNGVGKSSLLKIIAGLDEDYEGCCVINGQLVYVPQLKEFSTQSGGEQVVAYLREAFQQMSDILLLDEPSANLDQEHIQWLIHQLRRYRGAVLLVSHDRYLINALADKVWYLNDREMTVYPGNYDDFEQAQREEARNHQRDYEAYRKKSEALKRSAEEKQRKASKLTKRKKGVSSSEWKVQSMMGSYDSQQKSMAKLAKNMERRLTSMERVDKPKEEKLIHFKEIGSHAVRVDKLFHLKEGTLSVDGHVLFSYPELVMRPGEKWVISGRNQAGKTSFVRQLLEQDLAGSYSPKLVPVYFSQNFESLDLDRTILENVEASSVQDRPVLINLLTALHFSYDQVFADLHPLSGGERVKVQLAKALASDVNLLILDEPTNYLDLATIQSLERFLQEYQGAVILISHDRAFLDQIPAKEFVIEEGQLCLGR